MTVNEKHHVRNMGDHIFSAVKNNPEGLLLLAAGCALLMRSKSFASPQHRDRYRPDSMTGKAGSMSGTVSGAAETARDYVSDVAEKVGDTAQSYAKTATQFADDARRSVSETSGRLAGQAHATMRDKFNRVLQDQPLVMVFAGVAAGAAVASALPSMAIEKQALGSTGDFIADVAAKTGERLKDAAVKAGDQLKFDARERGLDADGLKEMVSEAADTFGSAVAGENKIDTFGAPAAGRTGLPGMQSQSPDRPDGEFATRQPFSDRKPGTNS